MVYLDCAESRLILGSGKRPATAIVAASHSKNSCYGQDQGFHVRCPSRPSGTGLKWFRPCYGDWS